MVVTNPQCEDTNMTKINLKREGVCLLITLFAAFLSAFGLHYFVYTAHFAPSGIDGISTMLQELTGFNAGYFSLMFNIPMLIVAWFILKRRYVVYTLLFTVVSSALLVLFDIISFPQYASGVADGIVAAVFSGAILGVRTGIMLKMGASTGGVDIAAGMIQTKKPHLNIERVITVICYGIAAASYFVYNDVTSILLSFVQMFVFDRFAASMLKDSRGAVEVKIITTEPEAVKHDIIYTLKHGATVVPAHGMFTDGERWMIISVINIRQIPEFLEIMKKHPNTFTYYGELVGVKGNFRRRKDEVAK